MNHPTSHRTLVNGLSLHHLEWAGAAPSVVFLPGFISNAYAALNLGAALAPLRRVLALDLRGRGQSDKPQTGYSLAQHLADVEAWRAAQGIETCILAGHSFGASLALLYAEQFPDRVQKLILFDGGAAPSPLAFQLFEAYHRALTYEYPSAEAYLAPYRQMFTLQPWSDAAEQLTRSNIEVLPDGRAVRTVPPHVVNALLPEIQLTALEHLTQVYPNIQQPVLLIRAGYGSFGKEDRHITDAVLATMALPHLQVLEMPAAGHTGVLTVEDTERDAALRTFVT